MHTKRLFIIAPIMITACFLLNLTGCDKDEENLQKNCNDQTSELKQLSSSTRYCFTLAERFILFYSDKLLTTKIASYNGAYLYVLDKNGIDTDGLQDEMDSIWNARQTETSKISKLLLMVTGPLYVKPMQFERYKEELLKLALLRCTQMQAN